MAIITKKQWATALTLRGKTGQHHAVVAVANQRTKHTKIVVVPDSAAEFDRLENGGVSAVTVLATTARQNEVRNGGALHPLAD